MAQSNLTDLFALMNLIAKTFHTPALLLGSNLSGIAYSDEQKDLLIYRDPNEAASVQSMMLCDKDFLATAEKKDVFLYENTYVYDKTTMMLCYNIFVNGIFYARFAMTFFETWKRKYLEPIVRWIGGVLARFYSSSISAGNQEKKSPAFYDTMCALIKGQRTEDIKILNHFGWYADQEYQTYVFRFDQRFPLALSREYIESKIEEMLGECCISEQGQEYICVCNLSIGKIGEGESRERLVAFLTEHVCKVGISNRYHNLLLAPQYLSQARWALQLGEDKMPMHWYYIFSDYAYEYIFTQALREFQVEDLVLPELFVLQKRDSQKGSNLLETLETYIRNRCNGQAAAKQLFIHRTTFLYRMNQIEEITKLDIHREETYKKLLISFELLRRAK